MECAFNGVALYLQHLNPHELGVVPVCESRFDVILSRSPLANALTNSASGCAPQQLLWQFPDRSALRHLTFSGFSF